MDYMITYYPHNGSKLYIIYWCSLIFLFSQPWCFVCCMLLITKIEYIYIYIFNISMCSFRFFFFFFLLLFFSCVVSVGSKFYFKFRFNLISLFLLFFILCKIIDESWFLCETGCLRKPGLHSNSTRLLNETRRVWRFSKSDAFIFAIP